MERLIPWIGRLMLAVIALAAALGLVGLIYGEFRGGRSYVLGELREQGLLTQRAADLWCRAGEDSARTDGFATFNVLAEDLPETGRCAVRWLGHASPAANVETRSIVRRLARRFRLPSSYAPLPDWEREELLVYHDPEFWLWGNLLLISRERQRVWYFRFVPEK